VKMRILILKVRSCNIWCRVWPY